MANKFESAAIISGKTAKYGGAVGTVYMGLSWNEIGVIVGIFVAVLGLLFGQFWAWKKDRREQREMEARLRHKFGTGWGEP